MSWDSYSSTKTSVLSSTTVLLPHIPSVCYYVGIKKEDQSVVTKSLVRFTRRWIYSHKTTRRDFQTIIFFFPWHHIRCPSLILLVENMSCPWRCLVVWRIRLLSYIFVQTYKRYILCRHKNYKNILRLQCLRYVSLSIFGVFIDFTIFNYWL